MGGLRVWSGLRRNGLGGFQTKIRIAVAKSLTFIDNKSSTPPIAYFAKLLIPPNIPTNKHVKSTKPTVTLPHGRR